MIATQKKTILFLAANPRDTGRLDLQKEVKEIEDGLLRSTYRDSFELEPVWATTPRDMRRAILKFRPQLVHFSGHGSGESGLILEDDQGNAKLVSAQALSDLFKLFTDCVECVVLNACYSEIQANAIAQHIPYTIGMNQAIGDRAAIEFAVGFYDALGEGRAVSFAFEYGCTSIVTEGIPEELTPVLITGPLSQPPAASTAAPPCDPAPAPPSDILDSRKATPVPPAPPVPSPLPLTPSSPAFTKQSDVPTDSPHGTADLDAPFYIHSPLEARANEAIDKPGALVRIKSPQGMGKSSMAIRVLNHAKSQGYRTVTLDFDLTNARIFQDLDQFAQWFCASVGKALGIRVQTADYWDDIFGPNDNATDYFEKYLLTGEPLTLALMNFDRLFDYPEIEVDFCGLLRGWYEKAKRDDRWNQLRLMIVYSQESYEPKDINQSPFNVGFPIELGPWTESEVADLIHRHSLALSPQTFTQFMALTGGHPQLVRLALQLVSAGEMTLTEVMANAATEAGIYRSHLLERLNYIEEHPELRLAMQQIVNAPGPVALKSQDAYRLDSMGLINRQNNEVEPLCEIYRTYFRERLAT